MGSSNEPDTLPQRIRCQSGSEKLDLSLCNIVKVPLKIISENYEGSPKDLDLSYNLIRNISPRFTLEMINLTKLDLRKNCIKRLPDNFGSLQDLVYLDVHGNELEALPLSMSRMTRLQYLCLSENPFRSPLRDFLGQREPSITGVAMAELVVQFLDEFVNMHTPEVSQSRSISRPSFTRRRNSRIHYKSKSMSMGGDGDTSASSLSDHCTNENFIPATKPSGSFNFVCGILIGTILSLQLAGYFVETSFLESLQIYAPLENCFKSMIQFTEWTTALCPKNSIFTLRAPPSDNIFDENMSIFKRCIHAVIAAFQ